MTFTSLSQIIVVLSQFIKYVANFEQTTIHQKYRHAKANPGRPKNMPLLENPQFLPQSLQNLVKIKYYLMY